MAPLLLCAAGLDHLPIAQKTVGIRFAEGATSHWSAPLGLGSPALQLT